MRVLLLAVLFALVAAPAHAQTPAPAPARLESLLDADGRLRLPAGFSGALDASGYRMETGPDGAPVFSRGGDDRWDDRFGKPGTGIWVYAAAVAPNGDVYVGGYFSQAGGLAANRIARWDGRRFHAVGSGFDGSVYALAIGADGTVYAGGDFVNAGTARVNGVARWDGAAWTSLGGGVTDSFGGGDTIYALAVRGGDLYAGGDFERAGGNPAIMGVARWNGAAWSSLGAGIGENFGGGFTPRAGSVRAIAVSGTGVFVAGRFGAVDAGRAYGVARWDAAAGTWSTLGGGVVGAGSGDFQGSVNSLAVDGGGLYVGGTFATAGTTPANNVARWDGAAWSPLGQGIQGQFSADVKGLALHDGALYATGNFDTAGGQQARRIARWQNGTWTEVGGGLDAQGNVALSTAAGLYVGGDFSLAGADVNAPYIARWTGTEWRALGLGVQYSSIAGSVYALAATGGRVYIGGQFTHVGGRAALNVAEWDGTDWRAMGAGVDGLVYALAVGAAGEVYVGGGFTTAGGASANRVARWNPGPRTWAPLGAGTASTVRALAVRGTDLFAGGSFFSAGGGPAAYVARWSGTAWSALGAGVNGTVYALAVSGADLYVGGDITQAGGAPASGVARWNGAAWSPLGAGVQRNGSTGPYYGEVYALAAAGGQLYVGGDFDLAGGGVSPGVARWDGGAWSPLGAGVGGADQDVHALAVNGGHVYATGSFETAGGQTARHIARWDGTAWSPLGPGLTVNTFTTGQALAVSGPDLFVGGQFVDAGGQPASAFGSYRMDAAPPPGGVAVVRDFDPNGPQLLWRAGQQQQAGFVFGPNQFGDRAKAVLLTVPDALAGGGAVAAVRLYFAYKSPTVGDRTYTLRLFNGTAESGPTGAALYSQSYPLAAVSADADPNTAEGPTVHTLAQPVPVNGTFFVVVDYGAYDATAPTDIAALAASDLVGARVPGVWEQFADGTWANVSDSWFGQGGGPGANGWRVWAEAVVNLGPTAEEPTGTGSPSLALHPATPNPFRGHAAVRYETTAAGRVRLRAFDVLGREVAVVVDEEQAAGAHEARFDAALLAPGVYVLRLESDEGARTRRVTVVR